MANFFPFSSKIEYLAGMKQASTRRYPRLPWRCAYKTRRIACKKLARIAPPGLFMLFCQRSLSPSFPAAAKPFPKATAFANFCASTLLYLSPTRMKRHFLFSLTLFLCSFAAFSQATVTVGDPYAVVDAGGKFYFPHNGEVLTVKTFKNEIILQKMDAQTLKFLKVRNHNDFPKDYSLEMIKKIKNRYYMFYSLSSDKKQELLVREIDFASGTFAGPGKKIVTVDEKLTYERFSIKFSYDSSALVVQYTLEPEKKRAAAGSDVLGVHVFDANLQEKWAKRVTMPYPEKKMNTLDYSVDAVGNVYIMGTGVRRQ
jgi:hypothetical protein